MKIARSVLLEPFLVEGIRAGKVSLCFDHEAKENPFGVTGDQLLVHEAPDGHRAGNLTLEVIRVIPIDSGSWECEFRVIAPVVADWKQGAAEDIHSLVMGWLRAPRKMTPTEEIAEIAAIIEREGGMK